LPVARDENAACQGDNFAIFFPRATLACNSKAASRATLDIPMDDLRFTNQSPIPPPISERSARHLLPRRLVILFATSLMAFSLTAWLLVRVKLNDGEPHDASTAEGVVRAQLDALAQGELQVAYSMFSPRYRNEMPFDTFAHVVNAHGGMFRPKSLHLEYKMESLAHADLKFGIESGDGERFSANYTVIAIEGRWWIDQIRWHAEAETQDRVLTMRRADSPRIFAAG